MFQVEAVLMTKAEADLHNEINQRHWSRKLGMEVFTIKERMVKEEELSSLLASGWIVGSSLLPVSSPVAESQRPGGSILMLWSSSGE